MVRRVCRGRHVNPGKMACTDVDGRRMVGLEA